MAGHQTLADFGRRKKQEKEFRAVSRRYSASECACVGMAQLSLDERAFNG